MTLLELSVVSPFSRLEKQLDSSAKKLLAEKEKLAAEKELRVKWNKTEKAYKVKPGINQYGSRTRLR